MPVTKTSRERGRLRELLRRDLDVDELRRRLREPLRRLVPFDGYCVNTADPHTLAITSSIGDGLSATAAARLFALEHAGIDVNPLVDLARARRPGREDHVATIGARPERSTRMRELFFPGAGSTSFAPRSSSVASAGATYICFVARRSRRSKSERSHRS